MQIGTEGIERASCRAAAAMLIDENFPRIVARWTARGEQVVSLTDCRVVLRA